MTNAVQTQPIVWFKDLSQHDTLIAGGKGANLGELTQAGFLVPPGFVVTADAFLDAMDRGGVRTELSNRASEVDPDDTADLEQCSNELTASPNTGPSPSSHCCRIFLPCSYATG